MTERKTKTYSESVDIDYETIDDVCSTLQEAKTRLLAKGGTDIRLDIDAYDGSCYVRIVCKIPETDEEMAARLKFEDRVQKQREAKDLAEYRRLAKKFGDM